MTRDEAIAYFELLERLHAGGSTGWIVGETAEGEGLLARLIPQHEPTPVLIFDRHIDRNDRALAAQFYPGMGFLLRAVRSLRKRLEHYEPPQTPAEPAKTYDAAQNCAIYCAKPAFQRWMMEINGLVLAPDLTDKQREEHTATKVKFLLRIKSRTVLNTDPAAAELWKIMRGHFKEWMNP